MLLYKIYILIILLWHTHTHTHNRISCTCARDLGSIYLRSIYLGSIYLGSSSSRDQPEINDDGAKILCIKRRVSLDGRQTAEKIETDLFPCPFCLAALTFSSIHEWEWLPAGTVPEPRWSFWRSPDSAELQRRNTRG